MAGASQRPFTRHVLVPGMYGLVCLVLVHLTVVSFGHRWWPILWSSSTFSWTAYALYLFGYAAVGFVGATMARRAEANPTEQYLAGTLPGIIRMVEAMLVLTFSLITYSGRLRTEVLTTVAHAELQKGLTPTAMMLCGALTARVIARSLSGKPGVFVDREPSTASTDTSS